MKESVGLDRRKMFLLLFLLLTAIPSQVRSETPALLQTTDKGLFRIAMSVEGKELGVGVNRLVLAIRDVQNREVTGAEVTVTPWMPEHGHGVWEKPLVTEQGGGKYRVENVVLIMGGRWEMRVAVKKGQEEDKTAFTYVIGAGEQKPQGDLEKPKGEYRRTVEYYKVPNVTLLNQDGKRIGLRSFLDSGKPVIVDFIFTTCTTICPILSAGFSGLRDELGDASPSVRLISISIDPEHDRPDQMKEYLARYNSGEGWDFLTGTREDISLVLKAFDAWIPDKMSHSPLYLLRGPRSAEWVRINGLIGVGDLLREFRGVESK